VIDSVLFEDFGGFVLDIDVINTGSTDGVLYDTFMMWFTLSGGEISFIF